MEDQGKRLLLAVAIAFALMIVWSWLFPPEQKEPLTEPPTQETPGETTADGDGGPADAPAADDAPAPAQRGAEQVIELAGDAFQTFHAALSTYGGNAVKWELQGKKYREDRGDPDSQIDLVMTGDREQWRPFQVSFPDSTHQIGDESEWQVERVSDRVLHFTWSSDDLRVVKKYELFPDEYIAELTVEVSKLSPGEAKQTLAISTFAFQDPTEETGGGLFGARADLSWHSACLAGDDLESWSLEDVRGADKARTGLVRWAGFNHSYFLNALAPANAAGERLRCTATAIPERAGVMEMRLEYPEITLEGGDPAYTRTVTAYLGPKYLDDLERVEGVVGYDPMLGESVDLGWFAVICRPLLWLLKSFHSLVGNWGVAIILLTFVVQLITLPWTTKSMRSMKAMARLRPEIEKLQKKYKDDKQRQQVEMMNLYKAHNVNPLAGCLPMLLQMPIWFALYRTLSVAAELYHSPFIPGWLPDLTAPDPYYVMPVLLTGMMFLQTRLQPSPVESAQQKIMMYGMPLMFGGFSLFFPSGLTLYILTNTVLRTTHQLYLNKTDPAMAAAAPATASKAATDEAEASDGDDGGERPSGGPSATPAAGKKTRKAGGGRKKKKGRRS